MKKTVAYIFSIKNSEGIGWHDYEMKDGEMLVEQTRKTVSKHYIHNISESRQLMNGFTWIKDMLLQNHNFRMHEEHSSLKEKGIEVFAAKTDAFHIRRDFILILGAGAWKKHNVATTT